jgi:FkbM family methyltransferase
MSLTRTLKFILNHPLNRDNKFEAFKRFVKWQLNSRLIPWPVIYPITNQSRIIVKKGMTGATGNVYCGLHDYNDMFFLLHFLRPEDLFFDIGANVGSYTVLASGHCKAKTIAVEPVPSTFNLLLDNIYINRMADRVTALNTALGSSDGTLHFTSSYDTINHVATANDKNTIQVPVSRLDVIAGNRSPALMKIDVEGYETEVIAGAGQLLHNPALKAIIIELNGSGTHFGYDERKIHETLIGAGFAPSQYEPSERKLIPLDTFGSTNTIYVRDSEYVQNRLLNAENVSINGKAI